MSGTGRARRGGCGTARTSPPWPPPPADRGVHGSPPAGPAPAPPPPSGRGPPRAPPPGLACSRVARGGLVRVCSARRRLAGARHVQPEELAGERWVAFPRSMSSPGEPYAAAIQRQLAAAGIPAPEIVPIDSLTTQTRMVEAEFGLALLRQPRLRPAATRAPPCP